MKKIFPLMMSLIILTGCGITATQETVPSVNEGISQEDSQEIAKTESVEAITNSDTSQNTLSTDPISVRFDITYSFNSSESEIICIYTKDGYDYFAKGLGGTGKKICGYCEAGSSDESSIIYFTGETSDNAHKVFRNIYSSAISKSMTVIPDLFNELAQRSADERIDPAVSELKTDITDQMPGSLSFYAGKTLLKPTISEVIMIGNQSAVLDATPSLKFIPGWIDDNGKYRYLDHISICFKIPENELAALFDEMDTAKAEEERKPNEEREQYLSDIIEIPDTGESTEAAITTDGWNGLYSGFNNGQYYYVWLQKGTFSSQSSFSGTIRLLWKGASPYEDGTELLQDDPRDIYLGDVENGYIIKPGWDGQNSSILTIDQDEFGKLSGKIFCFGFWMDRDTDLTFDGTTLRHK